MAWRSDQPPADERVYDAGSFEAELFWQKNRFAILFGGAVILAIVAAVAIWLYSQHSARRAAEALFAEAQDPAAWREVIAKYPDSAPAANAHFLLADSLRSQGKLEESSAVYQKFLAAFPTNPLAGGARLGLAENLAVADKTNEALAALREVQAKDSASYAAPFAALLEGRTLIQHGQIRRGAQSSREPRCDVPSIARWTRSRSPTGRDCAVSPPDAQKAAQ